MSTPTNTEHSNGAASAGGSSSRGCGGCLSVALGVILVCVGVPMLVCPGPGLAAIAAGLGMIGVGLGIKRRERAE